MSKLLHFLKFFPRLLTSLSLNNFSRLLRVACIVSEIVWLRKCWQQKEKVNRNHS